MIGESRRMAGQGRRREIIRPVLPLVVELQSLRECARLSQLDVSVRLGVGKETPGNWERGEHMMDLDDAIKYAEAVGYELVLRKKE